MICGLIILVIAWPPIPLLHSIYHWYKMFCFVLTKQEIRNLAIRILWICIKEVQNVLQWKNRQFSPSTQIAEQKCFSPIDRLMVAYGKWTGHRIALSDFYDLPPNKGIKSSISGPSSDFYDLPPDKGIKSSISGPSFLAHRSLFCGYMYFHSILLILVVKKRDQWACMGVTFRHFEAKRVM